MKRVGVLVDYPSSDEDESARQNDSKPLVKKRKLPALASQLVVPVPTDNPALHQGRVRTNPHVEGQFAAYVYIPLKISRGSALDTFLDQVIHYTKERVPILHPIGGIHDPDASERELHISLTRPIYLRAHQREEFRIAVRTVARKHSAFPASFANFAELINDERTRTFLTIEIGAGHRELEALCHALTPTLRIYRQKEFYDQPRFHASIAWALLSGVASHKSTAPQPSTDDSGDRSSHPPEISPIPDNQPANSTDTHEQSASTIFPTIPHFPVDLVENLEKTFGSQLRNRHIGTFDAECLCVKIGKEVHKWKLQGGS